MKANVYVDGFNLYYGSLKDHGSGYKWLDLDMLFDAFREDCEPAVVVSNDSDLEAPIRVVMAELGIPVGLLNPHAPWARSRDLINLKPVFFKQIRSSAVREASSRKHSPTARDLFAARPAGSARRPDSKDPACEDEVPHPATEASGGIAAIIQR